MRNPIYIYIYIYVHTFMFVFTFKIYMIYFFISFQVTTILDYIWDIFECQSSTFVDSTISFTDTENVQCWSCWRPEPVPLKLFAFLERRHVCHFTYECFCVTNWSISTKSSNLNARGTDATRSSRMTQRCGSILEFAIVSKRSGNSGH